MMRRSPTRIELKLEDLQEFEYTSKLDKKKGGAAAGVTPGSIEAQKLLRQERIGYTSPGGPHNLATGANRVRASVAVLDIPIVTLVPAQPRQTRSSSLGAGGGNGGQSGGGGGPSSGTTRTSMTSPTSIQSPSGSLGLDSTSWPTTTTHTMDTSSPADVSGMIGTRRTTRGGGGGSERHTITSSEVIPPEVQAEVEVPSSSDIEVDD